MITCSFLHNNSDGHQAPQKRYLIISKVYLESKNPLHNILPFLKCTKKRSECEGFHVPIKVV